MRQQVNLYDPILRQPKPVFSALATLQTLLVVLAALILFHAYAQWQVTALAANVKQLQTSHTLAGQRFQELQNRNPRKTPDTGLEDRVTAVAAEVGRAHKLADALSAGAFGNAAGMSDYLVALARQRIEGLWLTRIDVLQGGQTLNLAGRSLEAERVPQYLQGLSAERVFNGRIFGQLKLQRDETGLDFILGTAAAKPGPGGNGG